MILRSSGKKGAAFIETKNLDGETNLKFKAANKDIAEDFATDELVRPI
jgi:magnesium-transporting ATPase (P-type)